ncbi:hypothetical protein I4U23_015538 [Adineta vaga]|nr:hypothetical protein I4U23_015538 [Adineta vaga]
MNCSSCICYMLQTNSSAMNCYRNGMNNTNCLIFRNYSNIIGDIQVVTTSNSSLTCFTEYPPVSSNPTTVPATTSLPTSKQEMTTVQPVCSKYIQSTILLQLYNTPTQSYTYYSYVYRATSTKTTLMFCFLNQQYFWALDNVSMKDSRTNVELLANTGFEQANWNDWQPYNSIYYSSGIRSNYFTWTAYAGYYFYLDVQYTAGDGIFQNVSTVIGKNYTISFYLANPLGGNVSVAIVSVG